MCYELINKQRHQTQPFSFAEFLISSAGGVMVPCFNIEPSADTPILSHASQQPFLPVFKLFKHFVCIQDQRFRCIKSFSPSLVRTDSTTKYCNTGYSSESSFQRSVQSGVQLSPCTGQSGIDRNYRLVSLSYFLNQLTGNRLPSIQLPSSGFVVWTDTLTAASVSDNSVPIHFHHIGSCNVISGRRIILNHHPLNTPYPAFPFGAGHKRIRICWSTLCRISATSSPDQGLHIHLVYFDFPSSPFSSPFL